MITGLRRSALYVPCDKERMIEKALQLPADMVVLNLEDGISASRKVDARDRAVRALTTLNFGRREVVVRINGLDSEVGRRDLAAVVPCRPDGICLPKVESPPAIRDADSALQELESRHGLLTGSIKLHAMIETAAGVLDARHIAAASNRMTTLIFGSADYCRDVGCQQGADRLELLFALQMVVAAARAASIEAIDAPCFDIKNLELLRSETDQARRFGFDGKSAVHPGQLDAINGIFDVTSEEVAWAEKVLAELDFAEEKGSGLSTLEGKLIEDPHRTAAKRILRKHKLAHK